MQTEEMIAEEYAKVLNVDYAGVISFEPTTKDGSPALALRGIAPQDFDCFRAYRILLLAFENGLPRRNIVAPGHTYYFCR